MRIERMGNFLLIINLIIKMNKQAEKIIKYINPLIKYIDSLFKNSLKFISTYFPIEIQK
jgi:hypothetical protein